MQEDKEESLISHLEALRNALLKSFIAIGVLLPFSLWISPKALNFIIKILISDNKISLNYFAPMEVFILQIKLAFLLSFIIAFPYIAKNIWDFILPALYDNERKFIKTIIFLSSILFILGGTFCLFLILPLIINFGISFGTNYINPMWSVSNLINLALWMIFAFGIMFQVPLITHSLIKWNIVSYNTISSKRPYVVTVLLVLSALLTPPDIISQLLLFIPTCLLFELGLLFSRKN